MKKIFKRGLPFLLALVLVLCLVPSMTLEASAALLGSTVGSSGGTANTSNDTITATAKDKNYMVYVAQGSTTITLKNNSDSKAVLSFNCEMQSGSVGSFQVAGYSTVTGGSQDYKVVLDAGKSVKITVKSGGSGTDSATVKITIQKLQVVKSVSTTFVPAENGSYTVDGASVTERTAKTKNSNETYAVTATPAAGYKLVGWYSSGIGGYLASDSTTNLMIEETGEVYPVFVEEGMPIFAVGSARFTLLNEAAEYADRNDINLIVLVSSGTISGEYEIPQGVTLLIPGDAVYSAHGDSPEYYGDGYYDNSSQGTPVVPAPTEFRKLTMAAGTKITVANGGAIEVEGKCKTLQGAMTTSGSVSGPYGAIYMNDGSKITLNSGATLYAWGYIYGSGNSNEGTVTALSGAKVYEFIQVADYLGGSNLSGFVDTAKDADGNGDGLKDNDYNRAFPFSQYYIQNVEVPLTICAGAAEYVYGNITVDAKIRVLDIGTNMEFIGNNGMFRPGSGCSVTKDYDHKTDRLIVDINGNTEMRGLVIDMSDAGTDIIGALTLVIGSTKIDAADYIISLNNNMMINVNSGTTTIGQNVNMQPGVEMYIAKNATVVLENTESNNKLNADANDKMGYNAYVFDRDQWMAYTDDAGVVHYKVFPGRDFIAARYSPASGRKVRTAADLKDVKIDVNGKVIAKGFLYTTEGGANIISTEGTGEIEMVNGAGTAKKTINLEVVGGVLKEAYTNVVSAMLKNGNEEHPYTTTAGAKPGTKYVYCETCDKWWIDTVTITFDANDGSETPATAQQTIEKACCGDKLTPNAFTAPAGMKFVGWNTEPAPTAENPGYFYSDNAQLHDFNGDFTLYAQWEADAINVTVKGEIPYTVSGQVVTVTHTAACKVGYLDETGAKYVAITAVANEDGTYSFTAPEGVTEVLLVMKGDVNGTAEVNSADKSLLARALLPESNKLRYTMTAEEKFAAEVNDTDELNSADKTLIARSLLPTDNKLYLPLKWIVE